MKKRQTDENKQSIVASKCVIETSHLDIKPGEILTDIAGKQWKLGKAIGQGGFGEIFLCSDVLDRDVTEDSAFVAKIELHSNGPLFVEINCYLRIAKEEMINDWKKSKHLKSIGVPNYVASGSHFIKSIKYRFLIIPRFKVDIEDIFIQKKRKFNLKTVLTLALQLIDILEYIHSKGYIHADVKASNIALGFKNATKRVDEPLSDVIKPVEKATADKHLVRYVGNNGLVRSCRIAKSFVVHKNLRSNNHLYTLDELVTTKKPEIVPSVTATKSTRDQVYLIDYGLASKHVYANGDFKCASDARRAHAGTILFCSLDAHRGVLSRRSDLESLGYNMIYWLTSNLPWYDYIENPEIVERKKAKCMSFLEPFLIRCFGDYPKFLFEYFKHLNSLNPDDAPDYNLYRKLFVNALALYGYKNDTKLDFNNLEGWGATPAKPKKKMTHSENMKRRQVFSFINRSPLKSNLPVRQLLRKKQQDKKLRMLKWSKILMDPEVIMKQAKQERKVTVSSDSNVSLSQLDLDSLNPTEAMRNVYNNYFDKNDKSSCDTDKQIDGYTLAMMQVYNKMQKTRRESKKVASKGRKTANNVISPSKAVVFTRNRAKRKRQIRSNDYCPCCQPTIIRTKTNN